MECRCLKYQQQKVSAHAQPSLVLGGGDVCEIHTNDDDWGAAMGVRRWMSMGRGRAGMSAGANRHRHRPTDRLDDEWEYVRETFTVTIE